MNLTVQPGKLRGTVTAPASKSQAHRAMICAAFSGGETHIICRGIPEDIKATARGLKALGAQVTFTEEGLSITPVKTAACAGEKIRSFDCGESGSTLRFMIPLIGLDGSRTQITMRGRLKDRPMDVFINELTAHGMHFEKKDALLTVSGALESGTFTLPGNVSSQYISALLMALPLLKDPGELVVTTAESSAPYIDMTRDTMRAFGVHVTKEESRYILPAAGRYTSPGTYRVEGDWSNAAFWMAAAALGSDIEVTGVCDESVQGDRVVRDFTARILNPDTAEEETVIAIDASPDLLPVLAVTACASGRDTVFTGAGRLRDKESDRLASTEAMLRALGGDVTTTEDTMTVRSLGGEPLSGGTVDACGDHRIEMSAAVAATIARGPVTIKGAGTMSKSYPAFWEDYRSLGGQFTWE